MKDLGKALSHSFREECAVFGVWNHPEASRMTYLGLYALQHRGQEASGIVSQTDQGYQVAWRDHGLVADVFTEETIDQLAGQSAIGHNRYSTAGDNDKSNIQPLKVSLYTGPLSLAHNGNLVNTEELRTQLKRQGAIFQGTSDTEIFMHLIAKNPSSDLRQCFHEELPKVKGAYSMVALVPQGLFAVRDPMGFRPLVLGEIRTGDRVSKVVSSESCAFDLIGAKLLREIEPGEIYWVDENGEEHSEFLSGSNSSAKGSTDVSAEVSAGDSVSGVSEGFEKGTMRQCVFEHVYFARPDSVVFGQSVYETRKELGRQLAIDHPVADADLVIPVPDSGVPAALGYSQESGVPFELGIIRNHYVGRTFIEPKQNIRNFGVKVKLNPQSHLLKGKKVVVIDDSLVRGTTSKKIIQLVRNFGAKEVHMRIAAPPTVAPCYYGVDTPNKDQLIAASNTVEEIRDFIQADSLGYISTEKLMVACGDTGQDRFCKACFTGDYPL